MNTIHMINSVGDLVAGNDYSLDDAEADSYIIRGYAEGTLTREYSDEELAAILAGHQEVGV